jgi:hypothetical protein
MPPFRSPLNSVIRRLDFTSHTIPNPRNTAQHRTTPRHNFRPIAQNEPKLRRPAHVPECSKQCQTVPRNESCKTNPTRIPTRFKWRSNDLQTRKILTHFGHLVRRNCHHRGCPVARWIAWFAIRPMIATITIVMTKPTTNPQTPFESLNSSVLACAAAQTAAKVLGAIPTSVASR